jgi:putative acetyltransferase
MAVTVDVDDPTAPDVVALLAQHLAFTHEVTPAGGVFALDPDSLQRPEVTFFSARAEGRLLGIAALQELHDRHGELKSMHTTADARRVGVGRALVAHLLAVARDRGYHRVSLETGNISAFAPARALYRTCGFAPCPPYGPYVGSSTSACMTIDLITTPTA